MCKTMKAIFLDRDGTLIVDTGYISKPEGVTYLPNVLEALNLMRSKGYALFIISNQSGVGRGLFSMVEVDKVNALIEKNLGPFNGIAICPHAPADECPCRKPHPLMIERFLSKWKINSKISFMVGDKLIDAETGTNAGITGILIGKETDARFKTFSTLLDFAQSLP